MSKQISIDLNFARKYNLKTILEELFSTTWEYDDAITYLDNDDFEWKSASLKEIQMITDILENRFESKKIIGVVLIHKELLSGGEFLFHSQHEVSIMLNINRLYIDDTTIIDFSRYLKTIHPIIDKYCISFRCEEIL